MLKDIRVEARIVLATNRLRLRELLALERGSLVPLDGDVDVLSQLRVNATTIALGEVLIEGERTRFAVRHTTDRA